MKIVVTGTRGIPNVMGGVETLCLTGSKSDNTLLLDFLLLFSVK